MFFQNVFVSPMGPHIDKKSTQNRLQEYLKRREQKSSQKLSKKCPTWLQNRPKLGPCWPPEPSWARPRAKKNDTQRRQPKNTQKHKPVNAWNGKRVCVRPLVDPEGDLQTCVCMCLYESVCTTMLKNQTTIYTKTQTKINPKSTKNRSKIVPKSIPNRPKMLPKSVVEPTSLPIPFWGRF